MTFVKIRSIQIEQRFREEPASYPGPEPHLYDKSNKAVELHIVQIIDLRYVLIQHYLNKVYLRNIPWYIRAIYLAVYKRVETNNGVYWCV